ncbi:MAG: hypothetical protein QXP52_03450 [Candidatus Aenigmatarchaeota archaeon]
MLKLQISLTPELMLDLIQLISVIFFIFGTYLIYVEYKIKVKQTSWDAINYLEVSLGNKCFLKEFNNTYIKGVFDYEKIKSSYDSCFNNKLGLKFIVDNEEVKLNISGKVKKSEGYGIVYKDGVYKPIKIEVYS